MLNTEKFKAVGRMAARNAREKAVTEGVTANDVIAMTPLLRPWAAGAHAVGDVVVQDGYPYKCIQAHDATGNEGWNPQATPAMWAPYHATAAAHALPWRAPTHAGDAYNAGEFMTWEGTVYECLTDATVHDPEALPGAWRAH